MTYHTVSIIIAGACALFASLLALFNIFRHGTHFSNPTEQVQVIRILFVIPLFAIINVLCVWFDGDASIYIKGALDVAEAFPMAAFFLLENAYVVPDIRDRVAYFASLENVTKKGQKTPGGSLAWYKKMNIFVLQWCFTSIGLWVVTIITQASGHYCQTSSSAHYAHIWVTVFRVIFTVMSISSILKFYGRLKSILKPRGTMLQLVAFKIIVFFNFIQTVSCTLHFPPSYRTNHPAKLNQFIFSILASEKVLKANKYMSYDDLANGLPSLLLCCEMVLVATFMLFAYPATPYILSASNASTGRYYQGGPMGIKAFTKALNIFAVVKDFLYVISSSKNSGYRQAQGGPGDMPYQSYHANGYGANV